MQQLQKSWTCVSQLEAKEGIFDDEKGRKIINI